MSRRSLISEALAAAPAEPIARTDDAAPAEPRATFTSKRLDAFGEASRMVKKPSIRLKPSECSIWPGNARELKNFCESIVVLYPDNILIIQNVKKLLHLESDMTPRSLPILFSQQKESSEKQSKLNVFYKKIVQVRQHMSRLAKEERFYLNEIAKIEDEA